MIKKGYYVYDPVLYPHLLCVGVGLRHEDAKRLFCLLDGTDIEKYDFNLCDGYTYYGIQIRKSNRRCILVLFENKRSMDMNVICHESSHVCDHLEEEIGMEHGGEASAYLMGWIASCINKARLGVGEFVGIDTN